MNSKQILRLTTTALLFGLTLLLGLTPLGFITVNPTIKITLMCLPVVIGTVVYGLGTGLLLALVFGATSCYVAITQPDALVLAMQSAPFALYFTIFVPRLLIPLAVHGMRRLSHRWPAPVSFGFCAAVGSLANTAFFLSGAWLLGSGAIASAWEISRTAVALLFGTAALTNGLPEVLACVLICVPVLLALQKAKFINR